MRSSVGHDPMGPKGVGSHSFAPISRAISPPAGNQSGGIGSPDAERYALTAILAGKASHGRWSPSTRGRGLDGGTRVGDAARDVEQSVSSRARWSPRAARRAPP